MRAFSITLIACVIGSSAGISVGQVEPPPRSFAEQMTYDPQHSQWEDSPEPIPGTEDGDLNIARQWMARQEYKTAMKVLKKWFKNYPDSPRQAEALYLKGTAELESGDYYYAHRAYQELLNKYPGSPYAEKALSGEFRVAEQYLAGKLRKAWGGLIRIRDRDGGIDILNDLITNYPDTRFAEWAQLTKADYYYSRGEFELAEDEYALYTREYPRSRYHAYALLQAARSALAAFAGIKFDESPLVEARERYMQFRELYPQLARQEDVPVVLEQIAATRADKSLDIAKFYDKTRKLVAAKYYYRKTISQWPETPAAEEATRRLALLGEPVGTPAVEQ